MNDIYGKCLRCGGNLTPGHFCPEPAEPTSILSAKDQEELLNLTARVHNLEQALCCCMGLLKDSMSATARAELNHVMEPCYQASRRRGGMAPLKPGGLVDWL